MCAVASQLPLEEALNYCPFLSFVPSGHYDEYTKAGSEQGPVGREDREGTEIPQRVTEGLQLNCRCESQGKTVWCVNKVSATRA